MLQYKFFEPDSNVMSKAHAGCDNFVPAFQLKPKVDFNILNTKVIYYAWPAEAEGRG
jgi:hypothetical protein